MWAPTWRKKLVSIVQFLTSKHSQLTMKVPSIVKYGKLPTSNICLNFKYGLFILIVAGKKVLEGGFSGRISGDSCQIVLMDRAELDRELNERMEVKVELRTLSAFANKRKSSAVLDVRIRDLNDNRPEFVYKEDSLTGQYLVTIPDSVLADTSVFRVKAEDADVSNEIRYSSGVLFL